jgi:antirestriction protein ArdC
MAKFNKKPMTAEEREAYATTKRAEQREAVENSVRELMTTEGWARWIEARQRFHNYSFGNTMLIAFQKPDASMVASFTTWKDLGRFVRKGEHGIRILAPMTVKARKDAVKVDGESRLSPAQIGARVTTAMRETEAEMETFLRFKLVSVFDISQTDGEDIPDMPREPIEGDSHAEYLPDLERFAGELGYSVRYAETGERGGWCDPTNREVVVSETQSPNGRVRVLVHELAHALGVDYTDYSRADAEVIVETAAIIACGTLGLDTSGESIPYIAGWGSRTDLAAIRQFAAKVDECASRIERALGVKPEKSAAAA